MNKKIHPVKSPQSGVAKGEFNRVKKIAFIIAWIFTVPAFGLSQVSFWKMTAYADDTTTTTDNSAIIDDTQNSIKDLQKKLDKEQAAQEKLQQSLGQIKGAVSSAQAAINKTQSVIAEVKATISRKEGEINNLNDQIELQKAMLRGFLQEIYYVRSQPVLNVILEKRTFSDVFSSADHLMTLEDKIVSVSHDITENKSQLEQDKIQLAETNKQHEETLTAKVDQKKDLVADQVSVQQDVTDQQKVIDRLNKELSQLQGDLASLTGKSYSAKDIKDAVSFASDQTGVPKGFLVGVLKMESNLGANVGGCTYSQVESGAQSSYKSGKLGKTAWATFQKRRDIFKSICDELNINYEKQKVSCNPKGYTGTGGAMGVAQFMPDTWMGYKSQVASITGNNPPSPWDLGDGVTAMALKLKKTPGVTAGKTSAYKTAACAYLGTCYAPYINGILYWADNYKELL